MSQISYRADPHFVVHCLDTLLPQFAVKPYQEDMLKLVNIFVLLREAFIIGFGPELRTEKILHGQTNLKHFHFQF